MGFPHFGDEENFGEVFACASYVPMGDDVWKIRQVAVDDSLQGQGFGRQLMLGLEGHLAFMEGATCFKVHARKSVQSFYEKLGYEVSGTPFEEVGLPHVLMIKQVPRHPLYRPAEEY